MTSIFVTDALVHTLFR